MNNTQINNSHEIEMNNSALEDKMLEDTLREVENNDSAAEDKMLEDTLREIQINKETIEEKIIEDVNAKHPLASSYRIIPEQEIITPISAKDMLILKGIIAEEVRMQCIIEAKVAAGLIKRYYVSTSIYTETRAPDITRSKFFTHIMTASGLVMILTPVPVLLFDVSPGLACFVASMAQCMLGILGVYLVHGYEPAAMTTTYRKNDLWRREADGSDKHIRTLNEHEDPKSVIATLEARESIEEMVSKPANVEKIIEASDVEIVAAAALTGIKVASSVFKGVTGYLSTENTPTQTV